MSNALSYSFGVTPHAATATTVTVQPPAAYNAGGTLIMCAFGGVTNPGTVHPSTPAGWTAVSAANAPFGIFTKTAVASETSYTVTFSATCVAVVVVAAYPAATVASSLLATSSTGIFSYTPTFPTGVTANQVVLFFAGGIDNGAVLTSGFHTLKFPPAWTQVIPPIGPSNDSVAGNFQATCIGLAEFTGPTTAPQIQSSENSVFSTGFLVLNIPVPQNTLQVTATAGGAVLGVPGSSGYQGVPTIGMALTVEALKGAAAVAAITAGGATASSYSGGTSASPETAITPAGTGSRIAGALMEWQPGAAYTPAANTTFSQNVYDSVNLAGYGTFHSTAAPTKGTATTYGATAPLNTRVNIALAEILAAGTIAVQSTAIVLGQKTSDFPVPAVQQTAVFPSQPPAGSLLVATVSVNSNYVASGTILMALSDTSGLTWIPLSQSSTASGAYAGVWAAQMPSVNTWYVSAAAAAGGNGTSWGAAWQDTADISWGSLASGDIIEIDGGTTTSTVSPYDFAPTSPNPGVTCGMTYSPFTVGAGNITIRRSRTAGRNGTVVISGGRTLPLPYCGQVTYTGGSSNAAIGIDCSGHTGVLIDGQDRSGIIVRGAQNGLKPGTAGGNTFRNMELFDNGYPTTSGTGPAGGTYNSDGNNILIAGNNTYDRLLVHDGGQDNAHSDASGTGSDQSGSQITNCWFGGMRPHPSFSYEPYNDLQIAGFSSTHCDGWQSFIPNVTMTGEVFDHCVFGPGVNQGLYPTDPSGTYANNFTVTNCLFMAAVSHDIETDVAVHGWTIDHCTFYAPVKQGLDMQGNGNSVITNCIQYGGNSDIPGMTWTGSGTNVWWQGSGGLPSSVNANPGFGTNPGTGSNVPITTLLTASLTPSGTYAAYGSPMHSLADLLARIDSLNASPGYLFDEEFAGTANTSPSAARWNIEVGNPGNSGDAAQYSASTAYVYQDGSSNLLMVTGLVNTGGAGAGRYPSGWIDTYGKFALQAGQSLEFRAQLNPSSGNGVQGTWPAIWMMGVNTIVSGGPFGTSTYPAPWQEVDILESYGGQYSSPTTNFADSSIYDTNGAPDPILFTAGTGFSNNDDSVFVLPSPMDGGFHVYRIDCIGSGTSVSEIALYVDGVLYASATKAAANAAKAGAWGYDTTTSGGLYLVISAQVDATYVPPSALLPATVMTVDYVRAWAPAGPDPNGPGVIMPGAAALTGTSALTGLPGAITPFHQGIAPLAGSGILSASWSAGSGATFTAPSYATAAADLGNGAGAWVSPASADGAPDGVYASWAAPVAMLTAGAQLSGAGLLGGTKTGTRLPGAALLSGAGLFAGKSTVTVPSGSGSNPVGPGGTWTLAFEDLFPGTSLNTSNWTALQGASINSVTTSASAVSVSGGYLRVGYTGAVNSNPASGYAGPSSGPIMAANGSCCEASINFPNGNNWSAWWSDASSWPAGGEEDIAEILGGSLTALNYHSPSGANNGPTPSGSWFGAFHTYTLVRNRSSSSVWWDGQLMRTVSTNDDGANQAMIINQGTGGSGNTILVDYVRMWTPG